MDNIKLKQADKDGLTVKNDKDGKDQNKDETTKAPSNNQDKDKNNDNTATKKDAQPKNDKFKGAINVINWVRSITTT